MSQAPVLEGVWQMTRAELAGEAAPEMVIAKSQLVLAPGRYEVRFDGEVVEQGTIEIGDAPGAATLLLCGQQGAHAGRTIPCVFQVRGDLLRICFGLNGATPTEFMTNVQNQRYLATYRRA